MKNKKIYLLLFIMMSTAKNQGMTPPQKHQPVVYPSARRSPSTPPYKNVTYKEDCPIAIRYLEKETFHLEDTPSLEAIAGNNKTILYALLNPEQVTKTTKTFRKKPLY